MQQPPNPYPQFQQHPQQQPNYTQPQTYYPPKQPPIPPKKHVSRTDKILFSVIGAVVSIFILAITIAIASCSTAPPVPNLNATATAKTVANNATVSAGLTAITSDQTQTAMTPTPVPTTPTQKPTQQPVDPTANIPKVPGLGSENGPELGSPLSVFVTTFGPTTDNIWGIGGNDVSLAVDTTGSKVTYIFITTDDKVTWSKDQTKMIAFCSEFMPLDVATNGSPKQSSEFYSQNYTSSIGDFYMLINHSGGPGTWSCDMETGSN